MSNTQPSTSIRPSVADGRISFTAHFALIPEALYQEENADLWLNFGKSHIAPDQHILTAYIPSQQCYCVWESTAQERQTDAANAEQHCVPWLLAHAAEQGLTDAMLCAGQSMGQEKEQDTDQDIAKEQAVAFILLLHGKLQIATIHSVATQEDILYHILNIFTQWQDKGLQIEQMPTYTIGLSPDVQQFLQQYINIITL